MEQTCKKNQNSLPAETVLWQGVILLHTLNHISTVKEKQFSNFNNLGFIIGDSDYALRRYMITPFINPLTDAAERFNNALTRTQAKIGCTFEILKNRFQCLRPKTFR